MPPADSELMTEVRDGLIERLAVLFERYQTMLFNFFLRLTGNRAVSEDLVQEVFMRVLKYRSGFQGDGRFGDIDVTLPANAKASVRMKTEQGEIYTDFDMVMTSSSARFERSERGDRERYRISFDRPVVGAINGGGPEISLTTFSGNIYIRKGK